METRMNRVLVGMALCLCMAWPAAGVLAGGEPVPEQATRVSVNASGTIQNPGQIPGAIRLDDFLGPRDGSPRSNCKADVDNNGLVNGLDIQCFVDCFMGVTNPLCNCVNADMNNSGGVDAADIAPFVAAVLVGECVDPCANAVWNNGSPDGDVGVLSTRGAGQDAWAIDDFVIASNTDVTGLVFYAAASPNFNFTGFVDVIIVLDNGGVPGATLIELQNLPAVRTDTGQNFGFYGRLYEYQVTISPAVFLWPGNWWIGGRPLQVAPVFGSFAASTTQTSGSRTYVLNPGQNITSWTLASAAYGVDPADLAFCVQGGPGIPPTGACCWFTNTFVWQCVSNISWQDCLAQPGTQHQWTIGVTCAQLDPICGGGACCRPDGTCFQALPAACVPPNVFRDGEPCNPNPCVGACCVSTPEPGCVANVTEEACGQLNGFWIVGGTCPDSCLGACCFEDPQGCQELFLSQCLIQGGAFMGEGTRCTDPCVCPYQIPPNDNCAFVTPVPLVPGTPLVFSGDNTCATNAGCTTIDPAVWHAFTTTGDCTTVTIDYCDSPQDPPVVFVVLYTTCPCGTAIQRTSIDWQGCPSNPDAPVITWANLPAGTYYYPVYSDPADAAIGPYTITVNGVTGTPAANDMCADRIPISGTGQWTFDTSCCTDEGHANGTCVSSGWGPRADIWYLWTSTAAGLHCFSLCDGTSFDAVMTMYSTTDCGLVGSGTQVGCSDDDCGTGGGPSRFEFNVPSVGAQYLIRIGGWGNTSNPTATGPGRLTITTGACPSLGGAIDECTGAEYILCGESRLINLALMTRNPSDPLVPCYFSGPNQANKSAWLLFTATAPTVRIQTCNSPIPPGSTPLDTQVTLWPGRCGDYGRAIACSEDDCGSAPNPGWLSTFCANVTVGQTYIIEITSYHGGGNAFNTLVEVTCPCP